MKNVFLILIMFLASVGNVFAHTAGEEEIEGAGSWTGPLIALAVIVVAVIIAKFIKSKNKSIKK